MFSRPLIKITNILFLMSCTFLLRADSDSLQPDALILETGSRVFMAATLQEGETWLGLFADGQGYQLRACRIRFDDRRHSEAGETAVVSVEGDNQPLFLVRNISGLSLGAIDTCFTGSERLSPGESLEVATQQISCRLRAAGKLQSVGASGIIMAYRISVHREGFEEELYSDVRNSNQPIPMLRWAGDLDGDQLPDFLIAFPDNDRQTSHTLYLSKDRRETYGITARLPEEGDSATAHQ